jgi:hydroxypyruvate isomerase
MGRAGRFISHVQIADAPGRGAPGTGGIDFYELFQTLHRIGYDRHVGLEYFSEGPAEDLFDWLPRYARSGFHPPDAIMQIFGSGR